MNLGARPLAPFVQTVSGGVDRVREAAHPSATRVNSGRVSASTVPGLGSRLREAAFALALLFLPQSVIAQSPTADPLREQGKAIVAQAFGLLSSNLTSALSQGGPSNALQFCSVNALRLTQAVASSNSVHLRRITHKPRNPENKATPTELALLNDLRSKLVPGTTPAPVLRTNANGSITFYAPILLNNPACLNCHGQPGTHIATDTLANLNRLYPKDEATGFALGELRGLWRIDFSPTGPAHPSRQIE